jgi:PTS system mannose-specific IIA component
VIGLVLVSHGDLARSILDTASEIVGPIEPATALAIGRHQSLSEIEEHLREAVRRVHRGTGVLILADMFGGTAANVSLQIHGDASGIPTEVVTGFNLPMVLKASALLRGSNLAAAAADVKEHGQKNVLIGSEALRRRA